MTDIRRTLLWVIFTMSLVLLWDAWNKHNGQPSMFGTLGGKPAVATAPLPAGGKVAASGVSGVPAAAQLPAAGGPPPVLAATVPAAEQVTVRTDLVRATFDTVGATLMRLELLEYPEHDDPRRDVVLFDHSPKRLYVAESGLVSPQPGVALPNHFTPMTVAPGVRELAPGAKDLTLRFESGPVDGRKLVTTYTFSRGSYAIAVRHELINAGAAPVDAQVYLQLASDGQLPPSGVFMAPSSYTGPALYTEAHKFTKVDFKEIAKGEAPYEKTADNGWVAMVQHYFASAWLVNQNGPREFRTARLNDGEYTIAMVLPLGTVAPGATKALDATLYAGPQAEKTLSALAPGLELVKDYGWLTVLSKPLFWLLDKLHSLLGNWGWAIVALVVLLKITFYWLNASAYRSMAKMKAVAPKVAQLKERYKDKPQEMQQAMMRIYREEKVNPLGGCLPIVVQMPFFIALYWVLLSSVEMRSAPWVGWITDLSVRDPWFILPLLMTASSLFQVWLNPAPPDPVQAKMMWIMPLAFGIMFFFFPAGLVLYWLTNNILSIAQQWFINKRLGVLDKA